MPFDADISRFIATLRETLSSPIPEPVFPTHLFLACDGCDRPMRSETAFLCRECIRAHGVSTPEGQRLMERGMEQVDAMLDAANAARCTGRWN
jgi:hypothetical protein